MTRGMRVPLTQDASTFTLDTSALAQDTYAVDLTASDAAGNDVSDYLGYVTTKNVPTSRTGHRARARSSP